MTEQMSRETETYKTRHDSNIAERVIYTVFGLISAVLAFRFIFKLLGANPDNIFVLGVYALTQPIVGIFEGIFSTATINGAETTALLEPATLIAMVVVALIAWFALKITTPRGGNRLNRIEYTKHNKSENTNIQ